MLERITRWWQGFTSRYWFVPSIMVLGSCALAILMVEVDRRWGQDFNLPWLTFGPDSARALLTTVAGSMVTVAGVTFSITMVALTLASGQFGPRLMENYTRDRGNQVVLGTFLSAFVYCLLVLRVYSPQEGTSLPQASLATAFLMALGSLAVFIYFVHHSALTIQAPYLISEISEKLEKALDRLLADEENSRRRGLDSDTPLAERVRSEGVGVETEESGYLDRVEAGYLAGVAKRHDLVVVCVKKPGQFVVAGTTFLRVLPNGAGAEGDGGGGEIDDEVLDDLRDGWSLISRRSPGTVEFLIYELVELAVRSLSPGINDPFTAIHCIDLLGASLARVAEHPPLRPVRRDGDDNLRVVLPEVVLPDLLDTAFNQIRQHGRGDAAVLIRLLERLADLAARAEEGDDLEAVLRHADMVKRSGLESLPEAEDREDVRERFERVRTAARVEDWEPPEKGRAETNGDAVEVDASERQGDGEK